MGASPRTASAVPWQQPSRGFVKYNADAAFFLTKQKVGASLCLRDDDNGAFLLTKSHWIFEAVLPIRETEAYALLSALQWVRQIGLTLVILEVDCKMVADSFHSSLNEYSEFGQIINHCREELRVIPMSTVLFASMSVNEEAHCLTRNSVRFARHYEFHSPPCNVGHVHIMS